MTAREAFADDLGGEAYIDGASRATKVRSVAPKVIGVSIRQDHRCIGGSRINASLARTEWDGRK